MDSVKLIRRIFMLFTGVVIIAMLLLIFQFTDVAFRVWDRLLRAPRIFWFVYIIGVASIAFLGLFLIYKIWTLGRRKNTSNPVKTHQTIESIQARVEKARLLGVDVNSIATDIERISEHKPLTHLDVAFFGKISTGKSSLIRTLLPQAHLAITAIGGSTTQITRYYYHIDGGLLLNLLDMPGTHQVESIAHLEDALLEEARRAHIVCYVLDQDMTASDKESIVLLHNFAKPLIVILNKIDRYTAEECKQLREHIQSQLPDDVRLVLVSSVHTTTNQRQKSDGSIAYEEQFNAGDVQALIQALAMSRIDGEQLHARQRQAIIDLADDLLQVQLSLFRRERGTALVKSYARKAMLGGVAAVGPGTDVLIQGYLGIDMIKALTRLYDVPAQHIDFQSLISSASQKVKTQMTVILALIGNICKAFPGIGTVLGSVSHAVAYGLIFESLGNAICCALEQSGENTTTQHILTQFEHQLQHNLENRATHWVKTFIAGKDEND